MPNSKSAIRRERESARRTEINRSTRVRARSLEKSVRSMTSQGTSDEAKEALKTAFSVIDKAAKNGVIKKGAADRRKSRLAKRVFGAPAQA